MVREATKLVKKARLQDVMNENHITSETISDVISFNINDILSNKGHFSGPVLPANVSRKVSDYLEQEYNINRDYLYGTSDECFLTKKDSIATVGGGKKMVAEIKEQILNPIDYKYFHKQLLSSGWSDLTFRDVLYGDTNSQYKFYRDAKVPKHATSKSMYIDPNVFGQMVYMLGGDKNLEYICEKKILDQIDMSQVNIGMNTRRDFYSYTDMLSELDNTELSAIADLSKVSKEFLQKMQKIRIGIPEYTANRILIAFVLVTETSVSLTDLFEYKGETPRTFKKINKDDYTVINTAGKIPAFKAKNEYTKKVNAIPVPKANRRVKETQKHISTERESSIHLDESTKRIIDDYLSGNLQDVVPRDANNTKLIADYAESKNAVQLQDDGSVVSENSKSNLINEIAKLSLEEKKDLFAYLNSTIAMEEAANYSKQAREKFIGGNANG